MKLIKFENIENEMTCPKCGEYTDCPHCYKELSDCPECGEPLDLPEMRILLYTAPYHGANRPHSHTATLFADGIEYASVHVDCDESDAGVDVAWLQLHYIDVEKRNEKTARIISDFAKWARFQWENMDKKSVLPTLVRLLGIKSKKTNRPFPYDYEHEKFIALRDATKIKAEHLDFNFTSQDV